MFNFALPTNQPTNQPLLYFKDALEHLAQGSERPLLAARAVGAPAPAAALAVAAATIARCRCTATCVTSDLVTTTCSANAVHGAPAAGWSPPFPKTRQA